MGGEATPGPGAYGVVARSISDASKRVRSFAGAAPRWKASPTLSEEEKRLGLEQLRDLDLHGAEGEGKFGEVWAREQERWARLS